MKTEFVKAKGLMAYLNLSDEYDRKARYCPAVLSILALLPAALAIGIPVANWLPILLTGAGLSAVLGLGLSHLSSAMGNRLQNRLWPRWPHDSPTHSRLLPEDQSCSKQQKEQWYAAILEMTGLDIAAIPSSDDREIEATINDAVAQLRNQLWKSPFAERLALHNCDYGFARNLTGLRTLWIPATTLATVACWLAFLMADADLAWCIATTATAVLACPLGLVLLPEYVRQKANHYADSFFDAVRAYATKELR